MATVSLRTLLQALRIYLIEHPLSPDANSARMIIFIFKVINLDHPTLPLLSLEFCCHPCKNKSKVSKYAIRGRRRLHVGFRGWHWGREGSEMKLRIDCIHGHTPLQAVD